MKKETLLLFILLITGITINAQENWVKHKLSDKISVSFPKTPKQVSETSYAVKDSTGVIFATSIIDIAKAINVEAVAFDSLIVEREFAVQFLEGFKPSFPKYTFGSVSISNLTGFVSYQFEGKDEETNNAIYLTSIFINGKAYSFTCLLPSGKSVKDKNLFFRGITISK